MYSAMFLMCLAGEQVNIDNCTVMQGTIIYQTEIECADGIARFLNDEFFSYTFAGHRLQEIVCYEWQEQPDPFDKPGKGL